MKERIEERVKDISERVLDYSVSIIKIYNEISKTEAGNHIGKQLKQLLCSGTSIGANYEEACAAQSKADYTHKMQIILKETYNFAICNLQFAFYNGADIYVNP